LSSFLLYEIFNNDSGYKQVTIKSKTNKPHNANKFRTA